MSTAHEGLYCQLWSDHDLKEEYYGYRCSKCDLFIPYGSEPWICEAGERIEIDRFGHVASPVAPKETK